MDIHAPHEPVHSLRDVAVHIGIVTIGILIALSLEGLRETIRDHALVREARENFLVELGADRRNLAKELPAVRKAEQDIEKLVQDLPGLGQEPEALNKRLAAVHNPFYFFALGSWQAALSTGALAHMPAEEVGEYSTADFAIHGYSNYQKQALDAQERAMTFFLAHPNPTPAELREGTERLLLFSRAERTLAFVADQMEGVLNAAYFRASGLPVPKDPHGK